MRYGTQRKFLPGEKQAVPGYIFDVADVKISRQTNKLETFWQGQKSYLFCFAQQEVDLFVHKKRKSCCADCNIHTWILPLYRV